MARAFKDLSSLMDHGFDTVIDVRSPAEFAEDHLPGAINLPVLDNDERAEVGTIYVRQSQFLARKIGAAKVFRNAAAHIAGPLRDRDGGWRPLVYCWRGGQRSGAFGWMLSQIGWRAETIEGGYQAYRRLVHAMLYETALTHRIAVLDGYTGTAKTEILVHLERLGMQVIDLEGLANHRGSLLGARDEGQPSQKMFESRLAARLLALDPAKITLVEGESSKIGNIIIPRNLWALMKTAPRGEVTVPIEARTAYLQRAYADILADGERMAERLSHLRRFRGHEIVDGWLEMIRKGDRAGLVRALAEQHYDPAYDTSRGATRRNRRAQVRARSLDSEGLEAAAQEIVEAVEGFTYPPRVMI
ncbi:tRNA 2-selenouridine(34) synthase MnmH [Stappia sp.]|uniref:tRNA 2-selenouridine(34) synthase MnmH n=1 Tax=Stappia sp. TaxID=1870903 RepID=UPI003A99B0EF